MSLNSEPICVQILRLSDGIQVHVAVTHGLASVVCKIICSKRNNTVYD